MPLIKEFAQKYLEETAEITRQLDLEVIEKMAEILSEIKKKKGRLFFLGVGGGAGTGSHAANDFNKIAGISTVNLTDNFSLLTALVNDEGWESVFHRQAKMHRIGVSDGLFIYSVGGGGLKTSPNIGPAINYAKRMGARVLGVVGKDTGETAKKADACLVVPKLAEERITPHVEDFQLLIDHLLSNFLNTIKFEKAVFLDRDGVINRLILERGPRESPVHPDEFELLPGTLEGLTILKNEGYFLAVVSNQPNIAKGKTTLENHLAIEEKMDKLLGKEAAVDVYYYCPHHPDPEQVVIRELLLDCECRKPKPGLLAQAINEWSIDPSSSWMMGDSETDIEAGRLASIPEEQLIHIGNHVSGLKEAAELVLKKRVNTY
ncbi:HAD-IIIA family hydrolase [Candidatus Berkelbacteria bacterium]|nr:HAD-IIIA family hydrolase [Candidatus Berkelbacteria bacterium]